MENIKKTVSNINDSEKYTIYITNPRIRRLCLYKIFLPKILKSRLELFPPRNRTKLIILAFFISG